MELKLKSLSEIFKIERIPFSWTTIFAGKELNVLTDNAIAEYAADQLSSNHAVPNKLLVGIAQYLGQDKIDPTEFKKELLKIINYEYPAQDISEKLNHEKRKWRYISLVKFIHSKLPGHVMYEELIDIYSQFDAPLDMAPLISFIPSGLNPSEDQPISEAKCHAYRLKLLKSFLEHEKEILKN